MTPFTVDAVIDNVEHYLAEQYAERQPVTVDPLREDAMQWRTDAIVLAVLVLAYAAGWLTAWGMR